MHMEEPRSVVANKAILCRDLWSSLSRYWRKSTMLLCMVCSVGCPAISKASMSPDLVSPELNYLRDHQQFTSQWQSDQPFSAWQQQQRARLRASYFGPQQLPAIKAELQSREHVGDFIREHWRVQLVLPIWQEVWLQRPSKPQQSRPAVLLLHDHGAEFRIGKEKWFQQSNHQHLSGPWSQRYFEGAFFGDELTRAGFIVLAGDAPGFGQRGPIGYEQQEQLAVNLQAHGYTLAGLIALEDLQMARFLAEQAEVDKGNVATVGFSFGAFRAWQLTALSPHIHKAVGVGWFNQLASLRVAAGNFSKGQTAWMMVHPGLYQHLDIVDIAALASPKPLLIINGAKDGLMPAQGWQQATSRLCQLYNAQQANGCHRLTRILWPNEGHEFSKASQQQILQFLQP